MQRVDGEDELEQAERGRTAQRRRVEAEEGEVQRHRLAEIRPDVLCSPGGGGGNQ